MPSNRIIQIRVTQRQFERIQLRKEALGYATCSQFIRDLMLKEDLSTYKMIKEIYKKVGKNDLVIHLGDFALGTKEKIKESFYRGVWMTLFLIANNHEPGFLEKESEAIRDFHEKIREREGKN